MSQSDSSPPQTAYLSDKREELTEILRSRLIECGWRDQVANMCRNLIHKHGVEHIRLEQIISEVRPRARQTVPEHVKTELLEMIRKLDPSQLQPQQATQLPPILQDDSQHEQQQSHNDETTENNSIL